MRSSGSLISVAGNTGLFIALPARQYPRVSKWRTNKSCLVAVVLYQNIDCCFVLSHPSDASFCYCLDHHHGQNPRLLNAQPVLALARLKDVSNAKRALSLAGLVCWISNASPYEINPPKPFSVHGVSEGFLRSEDMRHGCVPAFDIFIR